MELLLIWIQNHLLSVIALIVTTVLIFHYIIEKDYAIKLSKKYRTSIYEAQSKIFLNATQHLILGNKDLAIKEFLNAMDINRETLEIYFALGGLFRSNGEIEKAISIHRSLIARENISEPTRLRALKELAIDFDKGGFVDLAIDTYKDVHKINRDQADVLLALCRIHEDIENWDEAYKYRIMLSKVSNENQSETISHILVQKAKKLFLEGHYHECLESLEDAFKFAPSVSAKILQLKLYIIQGSTEDAKASLLEILKEHPMYASFVFVSLNESMSSTKDQQIKDRYAERLNVLKNMFLSLGDKDLLSSPSIILSKIRLLKDEHKIEEAYDILKNWMITNKNHGEAIKAEFVKLLISLGKHEEAMAHTTELLDRLHQSLTRHFCGHCGYNSDSIFWRCPQCREWETIQFRWKI
ncbi:MAG: hypothetical protein HQK49_01130 [Oligoflexia bacterium]|nr:hypothetical protein [Oligoflexia bacterium]